MLHARVDATKALRDTSGMTRSAHAPVLALALVSMVGLVSCKNDSQTDTTTPRPAKEAPPEQPKHDEQPKQTAKPQINIKVENAEVEADGAVMVVSFDVVNESTIAVTCRFKVNYGDKKTETPVKFIPAKSKVSVHEMVPHEETGGVDLKGASCGVAMVPESGTPSQKVIAMMGGQPLEFGRPTIKKDPNLGLTSVLVSARNLAPAPVMCSIVGTFMKGNKIVGTANGSVSQLPGGATKTAELVTQDAGDYDRLSISADACL